MKGVVERLLEYIKYDTRSDEDSNKCPSTEGQLLFGRMLVDELKEIGLSGVEQDENGYVMGYIPSNKAEEVDSVGFIAHIDTSPEISGENINPKIIKNYEGGIVELNKDEGIFLDPEIFPELNEYIGKTIITTDGKTLLGADDKAGVAEIITACEYIINHQEIKHGKICIAFTPDEEIGRGPDKFNISKFGAKIAYTVDGGAIGELECENFNAARLKIKINGTNIHPGYAKGKMKNAILVGNEFISMLPQDEVPALTEGYGGFYHVTDFIGSVESAVITYIVRDFDKDNFQNRKEKINNIAKQLNKKHGEGTIDLEIKDQYYNMKDIMKDKMYVVELAKKAMEESNVKPKIVPIRGGTDGATLSHMGLPTPNIFTGGHNFHGRYEYIPIYAMEKAVEVIIKIIELLAKT